MKLTRHLNVRLELFCVLPLINVLFLALMLFTLSSRFTLQPGLNLRLPTSTFTLEPPVNPIVITVTAAPVPTVYFRDEKVTIEKLQELLQKSQLSGRQIILRADRDTPYERVNEIAQLALRKGFRVALAFAAESTP